MTTISNEEAHESFWSLLPGVKEAQAVLNDFHSALNTQVGGSHYKDQAIQPIEFIHANKLGFCEGNVIKYVTRWRNKNGIADLEKAKHYIELLIELETRNANQQKEKVHRTPA
jgi:hypothetical protein